YREFLHQQSSGGQIDEDKQIIQLLTPKATEIRPSPRPEDVSDGMGDQSVSQLPTISVEGSVVEVVLKEFEAEVAQQATWVKDLSCEINIPEASGQQSQTGQSQSTVDKQINCSISVAKGLSGSPCIVGVSNMADFVTLLENYQANKQMIDTVLISIGFENPDGFMKDVLEKFNQNLSFVNNDRSPQEIIASKVGCAEITLEEIADENGREFKTNYFPENLYVPLIEGRKVMNTVGDGNCGFNAIALGLLDNLTPAQLQVCINEELLVFDEELIKDPPFDSCPNPITGEWLKQQFQSIKEAFHNPQIVDKASIIKKHRWLQQVLAGSLRDAAVTAVDALWDQVMPQILAQVEDAVTQISVLIQNSTAGRDLGQDLKDVSDTCKYFGKGMVDLEGLIDKKDDDLERLVKISTWLTGNGKAHYLETLRMAGFNADNLPMEALIHHIQGQLSQSKVGNPRLVSAIASTHSDISNVDITTTVNELDIILTLSKDGASEQNLKAALESKEMKDVVLDFTD
ncbi:MAG: hypothetical protein VW397_07995, partial [Candidatus Margulisiibacteriota bacterium]